MSSQSHQTQKTAQTAIAQEPAECAEDYGSNEARAASLREMEGGGDGSRLDAAVRDLGEVRALDGTFSGAAGGVLDALLPAVGDKGKAQINVNVPVDQTGTVRVAFEFLVEAEREETGVKGRIQVGGGVTATQQMDAYLVAVQAFAQAKVFGFVECYGDSSREVFDLMALGIRTRLAYASKRLADAVFDGARQEETIRGMDADDYVESGLGAAVDAGMQMSTSDTTAVGATAGVAGQAGQRLVSDGKGGLASRDVRQLQVALSGAAAPFGLNGQLTGKWGPEGLAGVEAQLSGEAMVGADQLGELTSGGRWLSAVINQLGGILHKGSGLLADGNAARQAAGLAAFVAQSSGAAALAEEASARALAQLRDMGVKLGHKLTVTGTWEPGQGYGLDVRLERVSQIEYGDSPRALVYVLVEQVQRVFRIQAGG